jgi:uracil-DNA glycosylase
MHSLILINIQVKNIMHASKIRSYGNKRAIIAIVGDCPAHNELKYGKPFSNMEGHELFKLLKIAQIEPSECFFTTVFQIAPLRGTPITHFCGNKKEVGGDSYPYTLLTTGKYIKPEFFSDIHRLKTELEEVQPNIVITLGDIATWALLNTNKFTKIRGTIAEASLIKDLKVIPTYHPKSIFSKWSFRATTIADLMKARIESYTKDIKRPNREIWIPEVYEDCLDFEDKYMQGITASCDIEATRTQITHIGFAPDKEHALVIPLIDYRKEDFSYWKTEKEELLVWKFIKRILKKKELCGHNFIFDMQYIWELLGMECNAKHDTMLMSHSLQPELQKSLGYLSSIYTREPSWKTMRTAFKGD